MSTSWPSRIPGYGTYSWLASTVYRPLAPVAEWATIMRCMPTCRSRGGSAAVARNTLPAASPQASTSADPRANLMTLTAACPAAKRCHKSKHGGAAAAETAGGATAAVAGGVGGCSRPIGRGRTPSSTSACCLRLGCGCTRLRRDRLELAIARVASAVRTKRQSVPSAGQRRQDGNLTEAAVLELADLPGAAASSDEPQKSGGAHGCVAYDAMGPCRTAGASAAAIISYNQTSAPARQAAGKAAGSPPSAPRSRHDGLGCRLQTNFEQRLGRQSAQCEKKQTISQGSQSRRRRMACRLTTAAGALRWLRALGESLRVSHYAGHAMLSSSAEPTYAHCRCLLPYKRAGLVASLSGCACFRSQTW